MTSLLLHERWYKGFIKLFTSLYIYIFCNINSLFKFYTFLIKRKMLGPPEKQGMVSLQLIAW